MGFFLHFARLKESLQIPTRASRQIEKQEKPFDESAVDDVEMAIGSSNSEAKKEPQEKVEIEMAPASRM